MSEAVDTSATLYSHIKRPEWGLAIVASEAEDRQQFQFEDGHLRTFKKGYAQFLKPVDRPLGETVDTLRNLKNMLRASGARERSVRTARTDEAQPTLADQIAMFRAMYPGGFEDAGYLDKVRGRGASKHLKRHREGAMRVAQEKLSKPALDGWIAEGDFASAHQAVLDVLDATDMAPARELKPLRSLDEQTRRDFVTALRALLHGDGSYSERFDAFLGSLASALGSGASWDLATVLPALAHPQDHVCIRATAFRSQAKCTSPSLRFDPRTPTPPLYEQLRLMAGRIRRELIDTGMQPQDLVDVYDFIWTTQRPNARKLLDQVRS